MLLGQTLQGYCEHLKEQGESDDTIKIHQLHLAMIEDWYEGGHHKGSTNDEIDARDPIKFVASIQSSGLHAVIVMKTVVMQFLAYLTDTMSPPNVVAGKPQDVTLVDMLTLMNTTLVDWESAQSMRQRLSSTRQQKDARKTLEDTGVYKVSYRQPPILEDWEVSAITQKMEHPLAKLVTTVLLLTGLRLKELIALRIRDVDLDECVIDVPIKGMSRQVPVTARLRDKLAGYIHQHRGEAKPSDPFFVRGNPSRAIAPRWYHYQLKKAADDAGITKQVTSHTLRRTFAAYMM